MARRRRIWPIILAVLVVLLAAAFVASLWVGRYYEKKYITIDGVRYDRSITSLDLSMNPLGSLEGIEELNLELLDLRDTELTNERYDELKAALPGCRILWEPQFQGAYWNEDKESFTITSLTDEDIADLAYFPSLQSIDATGCTDYDRITALMQAYPDCQVTYQVRIGDTDYTPETESLTISGEDLEALIARRGLFTGLQQVTFTQPLPESDALLALVEAWPEIQFSWSVNFLGQEVAWDTTELDFSGMQLEGVQALEEGIAYLPNLTKVDMCGCGISNEEMEALNQRHENVLFVWMVDIGPNIQLRTDETIFMPAKFNQVISNEDAKNLRYLTELIVLDLGHHLSVTDADFLQYLTKLQFLLLADTGISDISGVANMKELKYAELFMSPITDYTPLLECTALQDLNLYYTFGDPEVISQMTWLKRLWWGNNTMSSAQRSALEQSLPDTQMNLWHLEATSDGWRKGELYFEMRDLLGMPYME